MKICFLMYPWERIVPKQDSTLRIIHEAVKRGHQVSITHPSNLTIRDSITLSLCKNILPNKKNIIGRKKIKLTFNRSTKKLKNVLNFIYTA